HILFATDLRFVNDRTEYQHAIDIAKRLAALDAPAGGELAFRSIELALADVRSYETGSVFTASFSERGDDLNQWRAYSANGTGFCIGFDPAALSECAGPEWQLDRCIYRDPSKSAMVAGVIEDVVAELNHRTWPLDQDY